MGCFTVKIYQLTNTTAVQMMGYVIKTDDGKVVVIDGGYFGQSDELFRVLEEVGTDVELWILTHIHDDHFGAIIDLFSNHPEISVKSFWRNRNDTILDFMDEESKNGVLQWNEFEEKCSFAFYSPKIGDKTNIGSVKVEVLGIDNPEITGPNIINDQSMVLKISDGDFSLLILGDLGILGGQKLLANQGEKLKADAVQMAHHGQRGVDRDVYEMISPKFAFWPTPKWLWDNTLYLGKGKPGEGIFKTPEVIAWMKELDAENVTSFDKTVCFDTKIKSII